MLSGPCVFVRVHQKRTVGLRDLLRPFQVRSSSKATRSRSASPPQIRRPMAAVPLRFPSRFLGLEKQRPSFLSFSAFGPKKKITELRLVQSKKKKGKEILGKIGSRTFLKAPRRGTIDLLTCFQPIIHRFIFAASISFSCSGRDSWQVACDPTG